MPITPTGVNPNHVHLLPHEVAHQRREYGGKKDDTIDPADQQKESWGDCATRYLCFVPNLIWMMVKKVLCVLTCGFYCTDKPSAQDMQKGLKNVLWVLRSQDRTPKDKKEAWANFCQQNPGAMEQIVEAFVEVQRSAAVGPKGTEAQRKKWDDKHLESCRKEAGTRLEEDLDPQLLEGFLDTLKTAE